MKHVAFEQHSDSNDDHSQFTHKGFAHGNGKLVELIGWGQPPSVTQRRCSDCTRRTRDRQPSNGSVCPRYPSFAGGVV